MLQEVALHMMAQTGVVGRAIFMSICRATRGFLRSMTWPSGTPFTLPTDRPCVVTGQLTVEGGEIHGVPEHLYTGPKRSRYGGTRAPQDFYINVVGPDTVLTLVGVTLRGVGVHVREGGRLKLVNSSILSPSADGVRLCEGGSFTMEGGSISRAGAGGRGKAVHVHAGCTGELKGVTISDCDHGAISCMGLQGEPPAFLRFEGGEIRKCGVGSNSIPIYCCFGGVAELDSVSVYDCGSSPLCVEGDFSPPSVLRLTGDWSIEDSASGIAVKDAAAIPRVSRLACGGSIIADGVVHSAVGGIEGMRAYLRMSGLDPDEILGG